MRLTRAAQRAQEGPESASEPIEAVNGRSRAALHDISPNTSPEQPQCEEERPPKTPARTPAKKGKAKGGAKKGAKGKKTKNIEEQLEDELVQQPVEQEHDAAVEQEATNEAVQAPLNDERPATPPVHSVRLTRRQMAAMHEEESKKSQPASAHDKEAIAITHVNESATRAPESCSEDAPSHKDDRMSAHKSEPAEPRGTVGGKIQEPIDVAPSVENEIQHPILIAPSVETVQESQFPQSDATTESKAMATNQPQEQSMSPESQTSSRRRASRSPSKSPMRIEESLEAIDALEEALDSLDAVTSFNHPIEDKSPRKKALSKPTKKPEASARTPSNTLRKAPSKTTIAPAKISRVPNALPTGLKSKKSSLARASSVRAASTKESRIGSSETVDYLASKRRPISLSFPAPPPPPKGRAPTKATFQLSSDDVVAKLKAQKEERAKREADGVVPKQRPIRIAPPPKSSKPLTKPTFQLPGEKTAEKLKAQKEERLKKQAEAPRQSIARPISVSMPSAPPKSIKPATKPTKFQLPGTAVAEKLKAQKEERLKRQEEAEAAKKVAASKARTAPVRKPAILPVRCTSGITIPPSSQPPAQHSTSLTKKRSSIVLSQPHPTSTSSADRATITIPAAKASVLPAGPAVLRGKEIFSRGRTEKEASERERTDKENAAKKAREEAAERGRIASREWAERQRKKMMAA